MGDHPERAEELVLAGLRGERPPWPKDASPVLAEDALERCRVHGVSGLVFPQAKAAGWPPGMVERLHERAVAAAIWEDDHRQAVSEVIAALAARGIGTVLLKGTALAYTCYADPALRERGDTDLLIPETARDAADAAILALGFARATQVSGEHVSYQRSYCRRDRLGSEHVIDLHWRVSNAEVLSRLFRHEELTARAVPAAALGPAARATCPVDALMIACMHREAHRDGTYWVDHEPHRVRERLIWLHDLHVLIGGMDRREHDELVRLAQQKALVAICRDGLLQVIRCFGTPGAPNLVEQLRPPAGAELPFVYFHATTLRQQAMNFRALEGPRRKLRLVRELLFPQAAYMRARYAGLRPAWLPWLYLRRIVSGSVRQLAGALGGDRGS